MDSRTKRILDSITANMPQRLRDGLVKKTFDEEAVKAEEMTRWISKNSRSEEARKHAKELLEKGAFSTGPREEIDKDIEREIDLYYQTKIEKAIKNGDIPEPEPDDFMKKMQERMRPQ